MISVVIPTYRNPKCLDWCLQSATEHAGGTDFEIIVVVDGFIEESQHVLDKYKGKVGVIDLGQNMGMQYALNIGVFNASGEHVLIVNDDNVFPFVWDTVLEHEVKFVKDGYVITPNQIEPNGPSIFNFKIQDFGNPGTFDMKGYTNWESQTRTDKRTPDGGIFPFLMSKRDYMMVGGFDTFYQSPFLCDWDFFLKLELAGRKFVRTDRVSFYHFGSVATKNSGRSEDEAKFKKSEYDASEAFRYKWGFQPFLGENNTHMPKNKTINGITF